jgi:hypothetical protein
LSERMTAEAHFMRSRYLDLNRSARVKAPGGSGG